MLREWVRNISIDLLRQIVGDTKVRGNSLWRLAVEELERRQAEENANMLKSTFDMIFGAMTVNFMTTVGAMQAVVNVMAR